MSNISVSTPTNNAVGLPSQSLQRLRDMRDSERLCAAYVVEVHALGRKRLAAVHTWTGL